MLLAASPGDVDATTLIWPILPCMHANEVMYSSTSKQENSSQAEDETDDENKDDSDDETGSD